MAMHCIQFFHVILFACMCQIPEAVFNQLHGCNYMHCLTCICGTWLVKRIHRTCPAPDLRASETNENRVHHRAVRSGLGLDCRVEYREIPICSGFDDEGRPIVEFVEWPFVLPHSLVTGQSVRCLFLNYFHIKDLFPD